MIKPEQMITAYAIVVGAHFLPYSWLYDSLTYKLVAILIPVLSFLLALAHMVIFIPMLMIVFDVIMLVVFLGIRKNNFDKTVY